VQNYPVRSSHRANLAHDSLLRFATEAFGSVTSEGDLVVATYGAIARLAVRAAGRELSVDVTMNPKVPVDVAGETIRRYNEFLESVTGYTAKERARRLRKSAGESKAGE